MNALKTTSNYHSKRKNINEDQSEICESERDVYQDQQENSRRKYNSDIFTDIFNLSQKSDIE